jgi:Fic family protein
MDKSQNYIGQIKAILAKTAWSQGRFAQELGVTFATVNRWLNNHACPHPTQKKQIEQLYKNVIGIEPIPRDLVEKIFKEIAIKQKRHKDIRKILQKENVVEEFLLELTYNSDAIEGSTLTKKQTEAVIFDKATVQDKTLIEHLEAVNHAQLLRDIFSGAISGSIDEAMIKKMHKTLMQGIRSDAGNYSKYQRAIRGVDLALPHPQDIPEEMEIFLKKVNAVKGEPVGHIARMHADFEAIHPFGDGNGRVGRLIMIVQFLEYNFAPCVISVNEKARYYETLEYAQKKSSVQLEFFIAQALLKGYDIIR